MPTAHPAHMNTSRDGATTMSLGSLLQGLAALMTKNFFLKPTLNLPSFGSEPSPLALSPQGPGGDTEEHKAPARRHQERHGQRGSPDVVRGVVGLLQEDAEGGLLASQGHGALRGRLLVAVLDRLRQLERQVLCRGGRESPAAAAPRGAASRPAQNSTGEPTRAGPRRLW